MSTGPRQLRVVPVLEGEDVREGGDIGFGLLQAQSGQDVVVAVCGEVDLATAPRLSALLRDLPGGTCVVVDLRAVTLLCAAGLNVLAAEAVRQTASGGSLVVTGPRALAARCLEATGLGHLVQPDDERAGRPDQAGPDPG